MSISKLKFDLVKLSTNLLYPSMAVFLLAVLYFALHLSPWVLLVLIPGVLLFVSGIQGKEFIKQVTETIDDLNYQTK